MNPIFTILVGVKFSYVRSLMRERALAPKIVALAFLGLFFALMAVFYFGLRYGFNELAAQDYFGPPLTLFVIEEFFLLVSALFVLSAALYGFFVHFRAADNAFLLSVPIAPTCQFDAKFSETIIVSSWPLFILGIPLFAAFASAYGGGIPFAFFALLLSVGFLGIMSAASALIYFSAALVIRKIPLAVSILGGIVILFVFGSSLIDALTPNAGVLSRIFQAESLERTVAETRAIEASFSAWPSHWFAKALSAYPHDPGLAWTLAGVLASVSVLLLGAVRTGLGPFQKELAMRWQESAFIARMDSNARRRPTNVSRYFESARSSSHMIALKDFAAFTRDPREYTRTAFIFFLLFIYMVAIAGIRKKIGIADPATDGIIFAVNIAAITYFVTLLSLRFAYPSVSLEGRASWVIWSSPFRRGRILLEKFFTMTAGFFLIAETMLFATTPSFGLSWGAFALASFILLALVGVVISLALYLGTNFADFRSTDPDRLSTSTGGLLFTFASLGYGAGISFIFFYAQTVDSLFPILSGAIAISVILATFFVTAGMKKINRLEAV